MLTFTTVAFMVLIIKSRQDQKGNLSGYGCKSGNILSTTPSNAFTWAISTARLQNPLICSLRDLLIRHDFQFVSALPCWDPRIPAEATSSTKLPFFSPFFYFLPQKFKASSIFELSPPLKRKKDTILKACPYDLPQVHFGHLFKKKINTI